MRSIPAIMALVLFLLAGAAADALAQTHVIVGGGYTSVWDDETFLGRGPLVAGGVSQSLGAHASVEGEVSAGSHHRDAGYLAADGTPVTGAARFAYTFRTPTAGVRPFASVGAVVIHSSGHLTTPFERRDWSQTQGGLEFGGGVVIRASERLSVRPEFRWTSSSGDSSSPSTIEPPLWLMRPSVSLIWRVR